MKKIQKKISLEQFKSRMPGIIDSYVDNSTDNTWDFSINYRNGVPYTNYGLIPKSIELDGKTVSYNTLVNWYHFIEFYVELLSINLTCGEIKYDNAVEYYNIEKQPKYKLRECEEFDAKCQTILSYFANINGCSNIVDLYSYLTQTYFPKYVIENEYKDIWNKSYLSLAEVHEWIKWFKERNSLYGNTECSKSDDCCDCEKYKQLGGINTYNKLKNFISQIEKPSGLTDAYATIPIILSTTIDDMGEYSIFYEEWVPGHDYGNQGHIVVNYDGESYILKEEKFGSSYNSYKELEFNAEDWKKREIKFQKACGDDNLENTSANPLENCSVEKYAYNHDGKLCIDGDINIKNMSKSYNINTNYESDEDLGFYVIKGVPYRCNKMNVVNVNGKLYQVYYDYENNPYITIGKKNYYGLYNNGKYTFKFKNFKNDELKITIANVVIVDNSIYKVKKETVNGVDKCTIESNGVTYNKIHAYSVINGNKIYFDDNYEVVVPYKDGNEIKYEKNVHVLGPKILDNYDLQDDPSGVTSGFAYCVSDSGDILYVHQKDYVIYDNTLLSGTTESKLSCFLSANLAVDNLGNQLPGLFQESNKNNVGAEGEGIGSDSECEGSGEGTVGEESGEDNGDIETSEGTVGGETSDVAEDEELGEVAEGGESNSSAEGEGSNSDAEDEGSDSDSEDEGNDSDAEGEEVKKEKKSYWLTLPYKPKTIVHITRETDVDTESEESSVGTEGVENGDGNGDIESGSDAGGEESGSSSWSEGSGSSAEGEESCEGKEVEKVWCDYLESITFYYSDSFGNKVAEQEYEDDLDISSVESKLKTKLSGSTSDDAFGSEHFLVSDLKCEFKYHMGCIIISRKNADCTYDYVIEDNGVTYYDNVTLVKKQCEFYLNNTSFYMMNYYDMVFETKNYTDDTYGHNVTVPIAKFSCKMNRFDNNNYVNFPLIREEYKLGSSSHEKNESDIYINRGTARAIDNHIKLMEVRSLESLEQYGNGYFKIIKN